MKRNFLKKLAVALAFTVAVTSVDVPVAAAAKPEFRSSEVHVGVGQTKNYRTKNNSKHSVAKFVIGNKKVASIKYKKGSKTVAVTGVKVGKTTLRADFKHYVTKKITKVRIPVYVEASTQTVSTQEQLEAALKNKNLTEIVLKTDAETVFTIPAGEYKNIDFVVDAPNADVENEGTFKSVRIENIKPSTWKEKAKGNNIVIAAKNARVVVEKGASVGNISLTASEGKVAVEVNGKVESVIVEAKTEVALSGKTGKVDVVVTETAKGAEVASSVSVNITAAVDIHVVLEAGAEGSKVTVTDTEAKVTVDNQSNSTVVVDTPSGNQTVSSGENTAGGTDNTVNTGGGSSSGGGSGVTVNIRYNGYDSKALLATATEEAKDEIKVDGNDVYYSGEADENAEVTVRDNTLYVGEKAIATLISQVEVKGVDGNGNKETGTAGVTWNKIMKLSGGVYRFGGKLSLPAGWSNPNGSRIPVVLCVSGQVAEDVYGIRWIDTKSEPFGLTKNKNCSLDIIEDWGKVTISSEELLDGSKLKVVANGTDFELRYDTEVIGILPKEVWVEGPNLKDPEAIGGAAKLPINNWWEELQFNPSTGSYWAVGRIEANDKWIDLYDERAFMEVVLKSNSAIINDIMVWDAEDATAYANRYPTEVNADAIQAAVASGSAVTASAEPYVEVTKEGVTEVTYTLKGELPSFVFKKEPAPYLLFSLEKSTGGSWKNADFGQLDGNDYAFSEDRNKMIACVVLDGKTTEFVFFWDVNGNGTKDAGDVHYIINVGNVIPK